MYFPPFYGTSQPTCSYAGGADGLVRWHLLIWSAIQCHLSHVCSHLWAIHRKEHTLKQPFILVLHNSQLRLTLWHDVYFFVPYITYPRLTMWLLRALLSALCNNGFFLFFSAATRSSSKEQQTLWCQQLNAKLTMECVRAAQRPHIILAA